LYETPQFLFPPLLILIIRASPYPKQDPFLWWTWNQTTQSQ
jgi:hypothetical protein